MQITTALPPDELLIQAVKCCDRERLRTLLDTQSADVNTTDKIGWSPLMWAVKRGDAAMVRILLTKGADSWFVDSWGATPFELAQRERRLDLMALLVSASRNRPSTAARPQLQVA